MAQRTIKLGVVTYTRADGLLQFGQLGDEVDVHEDDLERFDRLNVFDEPVDEIDDPAFPEGAPSDSWTNPQLVAYAAANGIDLGGATKKADILAKF